MWAVSQGASSVSRWSRSCSPCTVQVGSASTRSTGSLAQAGQCCWPLTVTRYRDATKPPRRSRLCPSTDSGTIAEMDARSEPGLNDPFEEAIDDALSSLPADLRAAISNVEIVVEDGPPDGQRCSACTAAYRCREGAARTAQCFPTRSASSAGRSRDSLPATRTVYAARSGTTYSTRSRITSGSATSG
jgi:hypothetical protein